MDKTNVISSCFLIKLMMFKLQNVQFLDRRSRRDRRERERRESRDDVIN